MEEFEAWSPDGWPPEGWPPEEWVDDTAAHAWDDIDPDDPALLSLVSHEFADVRVRDASARAIAAARISNRTTAELWQSLSEIVDDATDHPELYLRPDARLSTAERTDYSVRAAIADLAVQLGMSETAVRVAADNARRLRGCPVLWERFRDGAVSPNNARIAADTLANLPRESWQQFDALVATDAAILPPGRFRRAVHRARDRVHTASVEERHQEAKSRRRVALDHDLDGMSWLSFHLPSTTALRAFGAIDARARLLASEDDETRTLDQLRADVAGDLLLGGTTASGAAAGSTVHVVVTVPAGTLESDDAASDATVDGIGAVPAVTARELAALGSSFTRVAVDAVGGAVLDVDPRQYRLPEALRRMIRARDRVCTFAGCLRPAHRCDIDHIREWQHGGTTGPDNLMSLCRHHHRLKSVTRWDPEPPDPERGTIVWTSPTGYRIGADPPPF